MVEALVLIQAFWCISLDFQFDVQFILVLQQGYESVTLKGLFNQSEPFVFTVEDLVKLILHVFGLDLTSVRSLLIHAVLGLGGMLDDLK